MGSQWLQIKGQKEGITDTDFLEVARKMTIKKPEEKIEQVKSAIRKWRKFAKEVKVDARLRDSILATLLV